MLLIFCMVLSILPMTALAAPITSIDISGVTLPKDGEKPNNSFSIPDDALYEKMDGHGNPQWIDEDEEVLTDEDKFVGGKSYKFKVTLKDKDENFEMNDPLFPDSKDSLSITLNGILGNGFFDYERETDGDTCSLTFEFTAKTPILVYKTDEAGEPLSGANFHINSVTLGDTHPALIASVFTDTSGYAEFNLEAGEYILYEYEAPDGYIKSEDEYKIIVNGNGVHIQKSDDPAGQIDPGEPVEFVNLKKTPILVKKTDGNGDPLAGATIRIAPVATEAAIYGSMDRVSNGDGEVIFYVEDIIEQFTEDFAEFILSEYEAPKGYNKSDKTYNIIVSYSRVFFPGADSEDNGTDYEPVTFVNTKIPKPSPDRNTSVEKVIPALVKDDHFAYMQGYPGGNFNPEGNMSRTEAVVMFSRLLAESMSLDKDYREDHYPDVQKNAWYANQVSYMHRLGVLKDYARDGNFRPEEPVTRAEFAVLAAQFDKLSLTGTNSFTDVADDHWAVKYITSAASKGWINGYPDKTFKPEAPITRAEVVTLVNRMLERSADKSYLSANAKTLTRSYGDVTSKHWAYLEIMEASIGHDFQREGDGEIWTKMHK
jgi:hypothetical protein